MDSGLMLVRIGRALTFDRPFYREVAQDDSYQRESLAVLTLTGVVAGILSLLIELIRGNGGEAFISFLVVPLATAGLVCLNAFLAISIGRALFHGQGSFRSMLRTTCYSSTILCITPILSILGQWTGYTLLFFYFSGYFAFAISQTQAISTGKGLIVGVAVFLSLNLVGLGLVLVASLGV